MTLVCISLLSPLEIIFITLAKYQIVRTTLNESGTDGQDAEASGAILFFVINRYLLRRFLAWCFYLDLLVNTG